MQQSIVLLHHPDRLPQAVLPDGGDILPVNQNTPAFGVVKPQQQLDQGRFARARPPDQPDLFPRLHGDIHVIQPARTTAIMMGQLAHLHPPVGQGQRLGIAVVNQGDWLRNRFKPLGHDAKLLEERRKRPHDPGGHGVQPQRQRRRSRHHAHRRVAG